MVTISKAMVAISRCVNGALYYATPAQEAVINMMNDYEKAYITSFNGVGYFMVLNGKIEDSIADSTFEALLKKEFIFRKGRNKYFLNK